MRCVAKINSTFTHERNGKEHPKNGMGRTTKANVYGCVAEHAKERNLGAL